MLNERKATIKRAIIISTLLILNVLGIYLYYYVLIFNSIEKGKVYGESIFNGGRYEIYTLKYFYKYKENTYFDKVDYVMVRDLQLGDSMDIRVLKPYPKNHMVDKVYRDHSKTYHYHCDDGFKIIYNEHIQNLDDYKSKESKSIITPDGNSIFINEDCTLEHIKNISQTIDRIKFNRGSIIDYYMANVGKDTISLRAIYFYLNDFSTDAMPSKVMYGELKKLYPNKHLHLSVLEADNPKKERVLDADW